jgi:predicted transcriptional regulator
MSKIFAITTSEHAKRNVEEVVGAISLILVSQVTVRNRWTLQRNASESVKRADHEN